jgi:hypothetical protein
VGSGDTPLPHFNTEHDLGQLVHAILQSPSGKTVLAASGNKGGEGSTNGDNETMLTWKSYLRTWCRINGVPFGGVDSIPLEIFETFFPEGVMRVMGREIGEMMAFMDEFGYAGGEEVMMPEDVSLSF